MRHLEKRLAPVIVVSHDLVDLSELARLSDLARGEVVGIEPAVLVALRGHALLLGQSKDLFGLGHGVHEGFVAHDVLASKKHLLGKIVVGGNRCAYLNHVDIGVA